MNRKPISAALRYDVLARCNFSCYYCGLPAGVVRLQVEHVIPHAAGGTNDPWNLVSACPECNVGKSATLPAPELVAAVEALFLASQTVGVALCAVCGHPTWWELEDDPADAQCGPCNGHGFAGFEAGRRHGGRGA